MTDRPKETSSLSRGSCSSLSIKCVTKEMRSFKTPCSMARDKNTEHTTARHELVDDSGTLTFLRRNITRVRFSHRAPSQNSRPVLQIIISSEWAGANERRPPSVALGTLVMKPQVGKQSS